MTKSLQVVYVMGYGRSGSTLIGRLLDGVDGCFYPGEVRYFWDRLASRGHCACGEPLTSCAIWSPIAKTSVAANPAAVGRQQRRLLRTRGIYRLLRQTDHGDLPEDMRSYVNRLAALYREVADSTGADVIVDSSHWPQDAALLRLMPGIEPSLVHLVRDPRAVAHSWTRQKSDDLTRYSPRWTAVNWVKYNLADEIVRSFYPSQRSTLLRYEDFVSRPRSTVRELAARVGLDASSAPFASEDTAVLGTNHTFWGNPDRLEGGEVEIRSDDEWRSGQSRADMLQVTALSAPLLLRFGYPLVPRRSERSVPGGSNGGAG